VDNYPEAMRAEEHLQQPGYRLTGSSGVAGLTQESLQRLPELQISAVRTRRSLLRECCSVDPAESEPAGSTGFATVGCSRRCCICRKCLYPGNVSADLICPSVAGRNSVEADHRSIRRVCPGWTWKSRVTPFAPEDEPLLRAPHLPAESSLQSFTARTDVQACLMQMAWCAPKRCLLEHVSCVLQPCGQREPGSALPSGDAHAGCSPLG
jgi:hypothetical protein